MLGVYAYKSNRGARQKYDGSEDDRPIFTDYRVGDDGQNEIFPSQYVKFVLR